MSTKTHTPHVPNGTEWPDPDPKKEGKAAVLDLLARYGPMTEADLQEAVPEWISTQRRLRNQLRARGITRRAALELLSTT